MALDHRERFRTYGARASEGKRTSPGGRGDVEKSKKETSRFKEKHKHSKRFQRENVDGTQRCFTKIGKEKKTQRKSTSSRRIELSRTLLTLSQMQVQTATRYTQKRHLKNNLPYISRYTNRPLHATHPKYPTNLSETKGWHASVFGPCDDRDELWRKLPSVNGSVDGDSEEEEENNKYDPENEPQRRLQGQDLCVAIQKGQKENVKLYVESGGYSTNGKNTKGQRCVHVAAEWARPKLLKYLIQHGADVNLKDETNRLAIDYVNEALSRLSKTRYHPYE